MKLPHKLASGLVLLVALAAPAPLFATDGDLQFLADHAIGNSGKTEKCNYLTYKHPSCDANLVFNVYAHLEGASVNGITGAEYAAALGPDGAPDFGYFVLEIPNPTAATVLGAAFFPPDPAPRGVNIAWSTCQTGDAAGRVLLSTVIVIPLVPCDQSSEPPQLTVQGVQHASPSNVFFRCPLVTLCDAPAFTKVCLGSNITMCQTPVPPFPNASFCSTSGSFAINPDKGAKQCGDELATGDLVGVIDPQTEALRNDLIGAVVTLAEGDTAATCDRIGTVVREIEASILSGAVTPEHGQVLIDAASGARAKIGC